MIVIWILHIVRLKLTVCFQLAISYKLYFMHLFQGRGIYNMSHGIGKKEWLGNFWWRRWLFCKTDLTEPPQCGIVIFFSFMFVLLIKLLNCRLWLPLGFYNFSESDSLFVWYSQLIDGSNRRFWIPILCLFLVSSFEFMHFHALHNLDKFKVFSYTCWFQNTVSSWVS